MKFDSKTLLKPAVSLGIVLLVAYFVPHAVRMIAFAGYPFLAVLLCPLAMMFMMKGIHDNAASSVKQDGAKSETDVIDVGPDKA